MSAALSNDALVLDAAAIPDDGPLVRCHCGGGHFWYSRYGWQCSDCWPMPLGFRGESISLSVNTPVASREESVSQPFPKSPEVARLAAAFYDHLHREPRCCQAAYNTYCAEGERLRQAYYSAAQAVPGADCGLHLVTDEKAAGKAQEGPQGVQEGTGRGKAGQTAQEAAEAAVGAMEEVEA